MSALRKVGKIALALAASVVVLLLGGYIWLLLAAPADVRSEQLRRSGAGEELATRGRALLEEVAARHGYAAWRGHRAQEVVVEDTWAGGGSFWPGPRQRYRAQRLLGTFTSRLELLDGPRQGELWGIQSWLTYARSPAGEPLEPDPIVEFALPTFQYFDELVFRLLAAPIVLDNGTGSYRGREHQRIFVTWRRPEPHVEDDQYDLWIDPDSGLMAVAYYTVRDAMQLSGVFMRPLVKVLGAGTMHYGDYREVDGVQVAFKQTVTLEPPAKTRLPLDENYFHQLVFESASFDGFDPDELNVDPRRAEVGDAKPPFPAAAVEIDPEGGFTRPALIRFGSSLAAMEESLSTACASQESREIDPPFLPDVEHRQMQIDCDGFEFLGRPRWAEFVFRDDSLVMVWILTEAEEETGLLAAMTEAYGSPSHTSADWFGFVDHLAAIRRDKPEVFFYSQVLDGLYREWFDQHAAE